eukprot:m.87469 g.87469  ORF g.87469 m.87469 type:complete len:324 (-) comp15129_c0_seq1:76-1047(-)
MNNQLILRPVIFGEERVAHGIDGRVAVVRVNHEQVLKQINDQRVVALHDELQRPHRRHSDRHAVEERARIGVRDVVDKVLLRAAEHLCDAAELLQIVLALEQRLLGQHLGENTSDRPEIHLFCVHAAVSLLPAEHNVGCAVPAGLHVPRHGLLAFKARQSKVENLDGAVEIDTDVTGLQIAVDDAARVQIHEATEDLVGDDGHLAVDQGVLAHKALQVAVDQLCDQVDEGLGLAFALALVDSFELDDVLVVHVAKDAHLAVGPLSKQRAIKGMAQLLHGDLAMIRKILGRTDEAVCADAEGVVQLVAVAAGVKELCAFTRHGL